MIFNTELVYKQLVVRTRNAINESGLTKAIIGVSGGIDSALAAVITADAIGPKNVLGVAMPSKYSSEASKEDARELMVNLKSNITFRPIVDYHALFTEDFRLTGLPDENVQARLRAVILMTLANIENRFVICPSNGSEIFVGYSTIYGDTIGGFAPLAGLLKTDVYTMSNWVNESRGKTVIPLNTITRPASAELSPDQKDSDSLPAYGVLDQIIVDFESGVKPETIIEKFGTDAVNVLRRHKNSAWKRLQLPPGTPAIRLKEKYND